MKHNASATIKKFRIRCVKAPLNKPHKTASGTIEAAPLVLLDIETNAGIVGSSYVFVYTPMALKPVASLLADLEGIVMNKPLNPKSINAMLENKFRLLGNQGLTGIAVAAIDMALWDAVARISNISLSRLFGAAPQPLRVYDSLGQMSADETAREVEISLKKGFRAFKVKSAHENAKTDCDVIRAIRKVGGGDLWVAADFNQAFSVDEAIARIKSLEEEKINWIEEPVRAEDYLGHATVRSAVKTPVQTGENWWGLPDMQKSIAAGASDLIMPDAMKIGGVTGWLKAADLAKKHDLSVSSHLFAEISSHLMAATSGAYMLEWLDVAGAINKTPLKIVNGQTTALDIPGSGLNWNEKAIEKYVT